MSQSKNTEPPKLLTDAACFTGKAPKSFPTARYFQVHFEFLQEQIKLMKDMQEVMLMQMSQLEQRLLTKQQQLFSDDLHPFAAKHHSLVSSPSPAMREDVLHAGNKNSKKG